MITSKNNVADEVIVATMESLVPEDHLLRKIDKHVKFQFIYDIVKPYYSSVGRPSIDPIVLFKIVILKHLFGLGSMRRTMREIDVNAAYRWFLGIPYGHKIPDHSTYSQNYIRKFRGTDVFEKIFENILNQLVDHQLIDVTNIYIDSTHVKANANKKKYIREAVRQTKSVFEDDLMNDIEEKRLEDGHKPFKKKLKNEVVTKKISTTDPDCGWYSKGEKEKLFAYSAHIGVDEYGHIVGVKTTPGNVHDTQAFKELYQDINRKFPNEIDGVAVDSAYKTGSICKLIVENNQKPYMPYKRTTESKQYFRKFDYPYDEYYKELICPNNKILKYKRATRDGNLVFESRPYDCEVCPLRNQCFNTEKYNKKQVQLNIYHQHIDYANHLRYTLKGRAIYQNRSMTVERRFGDMKMKHHGRFTYYRGIDKVSNDMLLLFTTMNIKKLARRLDFIQG